MPYTVIRRMIDDYTRNQTTACHEQDVLAHLIARGVSEKEARAAVETWSAEISGDARPQGIEEMSETTRLPRDFAQLTADHLQRLNVIQRAAVDAYQTAAMRYTVASDRVIAALREHNCTAGELPADCQPMLKDWAAAEEAHRREQRSLAALDIYHDDLIDYLKSCGLLLSDAGGES